jgi:hypothetical protein
MRRLLKKLTKNTIRFIFSSLGRGPKGIINVTHDIVEKLYKGNKNVRYSVKLQDDGAVAFAPKCFAADNIDHFRSFRSLSNIVVLSIDNPQYQFNHNHLLDDRLNVIYQPGVSLDALAISHCLLKMPKVVNGSIAYLSNSNPTNYGHWFQYTFPLLSYYWELIGKEKIDFYYIGDSSIRTFQLESLLKAGISESQVLNYPCRGTNSFICVKENPNQFGGKHFSDINTLTFIRRVFADCMVSDENYPKRIFVRRGNVSYRKVLNEDALVTYLKEHDFSIVTMDGMTVCEQSKLFYNADLIVAPHGSALTNLIFSKERTRVLELFPYKYPDPFNVSFAALGKMDYYYMFGEQVNPEGNPPIYNDILIDMKKFARLLGEFDFLIREPG